jgi:hypothetical protein
MTRTPPSPIQPLGPGLVARRLRIAGADVRLLGAILAGFDHLASIHDTPDGLTLLVTTPGMLAELDELLADLRDRIAFEVLPDPEP